MGGGLSGQGASGESDGVTYTSDVNHQTKDAGRQTRYQGLGVLVRYAWGAQNHLIQQLIIYHVVLY